VRADPRTGASLPRRAALLALAVGSGLAGCGSQTPPDRALSFPSTREIANGFLEQMYTRGDARGAYERYAASDFKQHDPEIADGWAGEAAYLDALQAQSSSAPSSWRNVNNIVLVDGDLFALHHHFFTGPEDPGRVLVDIWRVTDGKIVEHWDVAQPIPRTMAHGNGMACGQGNDYAAAESLGDTIARPTCTPPDPAETRASSLEVLDAYAAEFWKGNVREPVVRWFSGDYRQHSPVIADGIEGAVAFLQDEYGKGQDKMPRFGPMRTIAEGGYVLRHRLQLDYGARGWTANIDIFRVAHGKISEHWDLRQEVPETAKNSNSMW